MRHNYADNVHRRRDRKISSPTTSASEVLRYLSTWSSCKAPLLIAAAATLLAELGFRTALTTIVGVNRPGADLFRLRRLVIGNDPSISMFAFMLQRLFFHPVDEELSALIPAAEGSSTEGAS